jgi:hypothetical protein
MLKKLIIGLVSLTTVAAVGTTLYFEVLSVPISPGGGGDPGEVPIDGGLSVLMVAGAAMGAKRIHAARKKQEEKKDDRS